MAIALAVHGDQHVRPLHLRAASAEDVIHGVLNHAQETQAGLRVTVLFILLVLAAVRVRRMRLFPRDFVRGRRWQSGNRGGQEFL